ncbi:23S ribosomal RNA methyltransferase [Dacryopinax primogenitus]|uniref:rRNA methyltransferase 2, mitochondrial n=1 Tax=Dacryopinax primogenitus (strain DJM 731) TaxID=1858805 RepID=M5GFL5_DACPD|nr:23S ribosomal RNA methyltransferase [Dacryopinax primogenitus]EJU04213.1 23S ribosomal RNA methyltransferase [Dacryopinax primogenitus]
MPNPVRASCLHIPIRYAHSASSSRWLARQKSDPFVRLRSEAGTDSGAYRSRAAFKLLEIQEKFGIIRAGDTVVDLGCAPGAWLQVAGEVVGKDGLSGRVLGVDLLRTDPLENTTIIQGDFLSASTQLELARALRGSSEEGEPAKLGRCVDVVLSDMAPNISGNRTSDVANSLRLSEAAVGFTMRFLRLGTDAAPRQRKQGGALVMKYFAHPELTEFKTQYLIPYFKRVIDFKPKSSRKESAETYWVCMDLHLPPRHG